MTVIDALERSSEWELIGQTRKAWMGIDPGKSGGIALIHADGTYTAQKIPATEMDLYQIMAGLACAPIAKCYLERVSSSPQMGVRSAFTFGRGYGLLLGLLTALKIPFEEVTPHKWQTAMRCKTGGDKNVSKRKAQQLFPDIEITHAIADALLIAEYARQRDLR